MTNLEVYIRQAYKQYITNCLEKGKDINQLGWALSFNDESYEYKGEKYYKRLGFKNNGLYCKDFIDLEIFEQKYKNDNGWYIFKDNIIDLLI